ncbi:YbhN family protein [Frankia sp. Cppng1_Ct_nod]|uniref:lysylphosphatidylglycerol synthase transmembrane domain-containing protein n=1 Tax=Frankia sp. Cppng1_Ct_nod TaxID=2897162 RepID=UPI001F5EF962|nr:YbhN family protein [Frankia sp. Cppng1_Ct_nod]
MMPGRAAAAAAAAAADSTGVAALSPTVIPYPRITHPLVGELPGGSGLGPLTFTGAFRRRSWTRWMRRPCTLIAFAVAVPMTVLLAARFRTDVATKLSSVPSPAWPWLMVCAVASAGFFLANACALRAASGLPLPLRTATAVQLAAAAANRVLPAGLGAIAVNMHYLERQKLTRSAGLSAVAATKIAVALTHVVGVVLVAGLVSGSGAGDALSAPVESVMKHLGPGPTFGCIGACLLAGATVGLHPRIRRRLGPQLRTAGRHLVVLARSPRRTAVLLLSAAATKVTQIVALAACVWAFGSPVSLLSVATIYLIGSVVAGAVPTAGNVGALEPALALGLTATGGEAASMLAAVLVYRLISYWLPVLPGVIALTTLRRRAVL